MASAGSASSRPRYAPDDPTLSKPWRALVDGSTGYLYYWNPETNVTQYERPTEGLPPPPPLPPLKSTSVSSSVILAEPRHHQEDDDRYGRSRSHQHGGGRSSNTHGHGHGTKDTREPRTTSTRGHGSSADSGGASSAEAYRRQNEIIVTGDNVPAPFITFESAGFPPEILKEVRYSLQGGANVVRCAALCHPLLGGCYIAGGLNLGRAFLSISSWVGLPLVIWFRMPLRSTQLKALSAPAVHLQAATNVGKGFLSDQLVAGAASGDSDPSAT